MDAATLQLNSVDHANMIMIGRLIAEVAQLKGDGGAAWIDSFSRACVEEVRNAQSGDGSSRDAQLVAMTESVVQGVSGLAKHRFEQSRG